ncbi:hypothetical protein GIB67_025277 [Kingdonia uniflora]|uniref:Isochorismatase-like domain-containing protein n=1 Tax=Kingdonia uniflora TaxID=39325 RepID=A0A7J7NB28_9MAGN|nr:hypothetical protein GIB67_025277 [Kingdonia uniflora]
MAGGGYWSDLPKDLLIVIAKRVLTSDVVDYIRFGAVCTSWRSVSLKKSIRQYLPYDIPCLLFPHRKEFESHRCFLNASSNKVHSLKGRAALNDYCVGSSQCWLVMLVWNSYEFYLLNPGRKVRFNLPSGETLRKGGYNIYPNLLISKVVISSPPSSNDVSSCIVMAIVNREELAFCKPGDDSWIIIPREGPPFRHVKDLTYCDGQFFLWDYDYRVCVVDWYYIKVYPHILPFVRKIKSYESLQGFTPSGLVESSGELLLLCIKKVKEREEYKLMKLDFSSHRWLQMASLHGHTLFLSPTSSFSILAANCPGLEGNCVYHYRCIGCMNGCSDQCSRIFNLKDGSIKLLSNYSHNQENKDSFPTSSTKTPVSDYSIYQHPVWVVREHDPLGRDVELFRRHMYSGGETGPTVKGTEGAELVDGLVIKEGDYKLVKTRFSAFFSTHLHSFLQGNGINSLVIIGVQTPNCIRQSVYDAVELDYKSVTVIIDATAAATREVHLANISDMRNIGVATPSLQEWCSPDA